MQAECPDQEEERHDQCNVGDHARDEDGVERLPPAAEVDDRDRISCGDADQEVEEGDPDADDQAVADAGQQVLGTGRQEGAGGGIGGPAVLVRDLLAAIAEDRLEVGERRVGRQPVRRHRGDVRLGLQARGEQPEHRPHDIDQEQGRAGGDQQRPAQRRQPLPPRPAALGHRRGGSRALSDGGRGHGIRAAACRGRG